MNIILDTNILRRDLKLKDRNFDILLDYLEKTGSKIIFPEIVFKEAIGIYERNLKEKISEHQKHLIKLNGAVTSNRLENFEIDIEFEKKCYGDFLKTRLSISEESIVPYKNEYLKELVERAINRIKPLGENGQQFRDGLLWLSILDITIQTDEKRIIFISDNPKDFTLKGEKKLAPELKKEANEKGVEIIFFKTVSDFAKEHASKLSFVDEDWIKEFIDKGKIEGIFNEIISPKDNEILDYYKYTLEPSEESTGYINSTSYINTSLIDFFVYEMSDGTILLNIEFEFEKEYEVEISRTVERDRSDYEYQYDFDPSTGELNGIPIFVPRIDFEVENDSKIINPLLRGKYVISIKDKKIIDYNFKSWDWG